MSATKPGANIGPISAIMASFLGYNQKHLQAKYTTNAFVLVKFEQKRYIFVVHLVRKYFCLYPKNVSSLYLLVNKESNIKCLKYLNYFAKFKLYSQIPSSCALFIKKVK